MRLILVAICLLVTAAPVAAQTAPCAVVTGQLLPDLVPDRNVLNEHIVFNAQTYAADSCSVAEGDVPGPGTFNLMWFDAGTINNGMTDLVIGDPAQCPQLFEFSPCHNHYHIKGYSAYRLWTPDGFKQWTSGRDLSKPASDPVNKTILDNAVVAQKLVSGHKQGFCVEDFYCGHIDSAGPSTSGLFGNDCWTQGHKHDTFKFTCFNQGLTVGWGDAYLGWSDKYNAGLDGQFIIMSGPGAFTVPAGKYVLELHVNPEHVLPESDYTNNSTYIYVVIK